MVAALFISLLILLVLGVPVFVSLGLSSLIAVAGFSDFPLMIIVQRMIGGVDKFSLMAIPFFILAANVMKTGGIARRILDWAGCMVGHQRGGMAVTTEVACMFFGAVSGSSPATVLAIGGLTYPKMVEQGYPKSFSTGLITSSGSVALLIPPSISAIVYCSVTGASVGALFMAVVRVCSMAFASCCTASGMPKSITFPKHPRLLAENVGRSRRMQPGHSAFLLSSSAAFMPVSLHRPKPLAFPQCTRSLSACSFTRK